MNTYNIIMDKAFIKMITKQLILNKKLMAIRIIKTRYNIGLKAAKNICDEVWYYENSQIVHKITKKKAIRKYLRYALIGIEYRQI